MALLSPEFSLQSILTFSCALQWQLRPWWNILWSNWFCFPEYCSLQKKTQNDGQSTNAEETLKKEHELQIMFSSAFKNVTCSHIQKLRNSHINEVKSLRLFVVPQFSTKACHNQYKGKHNRAG